MKERKSVVYQEWLESERGWGVRSDGYSLHLTLEDCKQFIKEYWDSMPNFVPDYYSAPSGNPQVQMVVENLYQELKKLEVQGKHGLRFYGSFQES